MFRCIECGSPAESLVTEFSVDIKKLKHCEQCHEVVDKFIEYDNVLIFLDILLHKHQAYSHVLFNCKIKTKMLFQLLVLSILCDTYMRWIAFRQFFLTKSPPSQNLHVFVELNFYIMLAITCLVILANVLVIAGIVLFSQYRSKLITRISSESIGNAVQMIILSSYGKLLGIPALIWGQESSYGFLWLTQILVLTSNAEALKVTSYRKFSEAVCYVLCGFIAGYLLETYSLQLLFADWGCNGII